jgi:hypothetical protein
MAFPGVADISRESLKEWRIIIDKAEAFLDGFPCQGSVCETEPISRKLIWLKSGRTINECYCTSHVID